MSAVQEQPTIGRPRKFQSVEELQAGITAYFDTEAAAGRPFTMAGLARDAGNHEEGSQIRLEGDEKGRKNEERYERNESFLKRANQLLAFLQPHRQVKDQRDL